MKITKEEALKVYAENADVVPTAVDLAWRIMKCLADAGRISDELVREFNEARPSVSICAWCMCTSGTGPERLEFAKLVHRQLVDRVMACFSHEVDEESKRYIASMQVSDNPSYKSAVKDFTVRFDAYLCENGSVVERVTSR